jgi:hypothetical protein
LFLGFAVANLFIALISSQYNKAEEERNKHLQR